ncbi:MAG: hypothetical protein JXM74_07220 [Fusobacteriaceae bacterium]|nr:hypothetical protein [Fusobacteriaceae bacterium]
MNILEYGGTCIKKDIRLRNEEQKLILVIACMGFFDEIEVTTKDKYESIKVGDKVKIAYTLQSDKVSKEQNGQKKVDVLTILKPIGLEKVEKRDKTFDELGSVEVVVLSKEAHSMTNKETGEPVRWWRANLEGDISLEHKITEDEYKLLKEFNKYKATIIPVEQNYKKVVKVLDWEFLGENERKYSL